MLKGVISRLSSATAYVLKGITSRPSSRITVVHIMANELVKEAHIAGNKLVKVASSCGINTVLSEPYHRHIVSCQLQLLSSSSFLVGDKARRT